MGKGDIKTRRGKIANGTYGVKRKRAKSKSGEAVAEKKSTTKKK